jgi:hypothetical protein
MRSHNNRSVRSSFQKHLACHQVPPLRCARLVNSNGLSETGQWKRKRKPRNVKSGVNAKCGHQIRRSDLRKAKRGNGPRSEHRLRRDYRFPRECSSSQVSFGGVKRRACFRDCPVQSVLTAPFASKSKAQRQGAAQVHRFEFRLREMLWRVCAVGHISPNETLWVGRCSYTEQLQRHYKPESRNSVLSFFVESRVSSESCQQPSPASSSRSIFLRVPKFESVRVR